jgi:hypothetical protein
MPLNFYSRWKSYQCDRYFLRAYSQIVRHLTSSLRHLTATYFRHIAAFATSSGNSATSSGKCDIKSLFKEGYTLRTYNSNHIFLISNVAFWNRKKQTTKTTGHA